MNSAIIKFCFVILSIALVFVSCDKNQDDIVEDITLFVSSEMDEYTPWGSDDTYNGLKIMEKGSEVWQVIPLNGIEGYEYQEGYRYVLKVQKTNLASPPMDSSEIKYKFVNVVDRTKVD